MKQIIIKKTGIDHPIPLFSAVNDLANPIGYITANGLKTLIDEGFTNPLSSKFIEHNYPKETKNCFAYPERSEFHEIATTACISRLVVNATDSQLTMKEQQLRDAAPELKKALEEIITTGYYDKDSGTKAINLLNRLQ